MASRSLNKVLLIGNLTRDPELRYTPTGTAVCTFGLATNRQWTTEEGGKREDAEFHNIVCWTRLAEICAEYLKKGSQAYVEGRLSTREWEGQDGQKRRTTEIIAESVIFLSGGGAGARVSHAEDIDLPADFGSGKTTKDTETEDKTKKSSDKPRSSEPEGEDIPF
ncbi:MAG: single-stranded DNA-binding protein [Candidatus Blackburnbacteria bacterium]|nr:single-stranded DNA-binding protein [Candidatus Blackburnbacteria bacterium]